MLKKEILRRILLSLVLWLLLVALNLPFSVSLLILGFGVLVGVFLHDLDHLIYVLYLAPHEFTSQRIKRFFDIKQYKTGLSLVFETESERGKLIFHSFLFQMALILVSLFVLTSSLSFAGKGLVLGLMLHSLIDFWSSIMKNKGDLWFWQTSFRPTKEIQFTIFGAYLLFFLVSSLFLV